METVTPFRVLAIELTTLYMALKRGDVLTPLDVLERVARAADEAAKYAEQPTQPLPRLTAAQFDALRNSEWTVDEP